MPDVHAALQGAATALLSTASEPVLRQILRELLAEQDPAPPNALGTIQAANALARTAPGAELAERPLSRPHKSVQPPKNGHDTPSNGPDRASSASHPAANGANDPFVEWPQLRHQIRTAMAERDIDFVQLAKELNYTAATLQQAVGTNKPKTKRLAERLAGWLANPDRVAAEAPAKSRPPFRAGAGRAGARASSGAAAA